jgi:hypothetical protein
MMYLCAGTWVHACMHASIYVYMYVWIMDATLKFGYKCMYECIHAYEDLLCARDIVTTLTTR